jgi:hypothetical protein
MPTKRPGRSASPTRHEAAKGEAAKGEAAKGETDGGSATYTPAELT